jgi:hypothetical protein
MAEPTHLPFPRSLRYGQPLEIEFESPDTARGASGAKFVRAENGSEYIIKGPSLAQEHPQVAANELIAAQLAEQIGLPILDHRVLSNGTDLFFASARMPRGSYDTLSEDVYARCTNRSEIYTVVAFDVWIANGDRHAENLLARPSSDAIESQTFGLLVNDHSHTFVWPRESVDVLVGLIDAPLDCAARRFVRLGFVQNDITDESLVSEALDRIESIPDDALTDIVASVPPGLIGDDERPQYERFLIERRRRLRSIFAGGGQLLPNLRRVAP